MRLHTGHKIQIIIAIIAVIHVIGFIVYLFVNGTGST
jgi:hypothetical protein